MNHHDIVIFFLQISVMLTVALACGQVMRRFHLPVVVGELIGGILLGPTVFGVLAPHAEMWLFPMNGPLSGIRDAVIKLGMSVVKLALFLGTALSISALPVTARILMDLGLIKKKLGTIVMASATMNDLVGWSLFALLLSSFAPEGTSPKSLWVTLSLVVGFFVLMLGIRKWKGYRALRWLRSHLPWPSGFIGAAAILVLIAAATTEAMGLHAVFGAFLVGVALAPNSDSNRNHRSRGLKANFIAHFDWPLVLVVLLIACVGKICGAGFGAWIGGLPRREAVAVGFGMNARGAMEMILASVALEYHLIDQCLFVALIVMAIVTSLLSGPVMQRLLMSTSTAEEAVRRLRFVQIRHEVERPLAPLSPVKFRES